MYAPILERIFKSIGKKAKVMIVKDYDSLGVHIKDGILDLSLIHIFRRVQEISSEPEKEIIKKIEKTDKYRAEYYRYYTGKEWNDARNYDFCLNTTSMSYEKRCV